MIQCLIPMATQLTIVYTAAGKVQEREQNFLYNLVEMSKFP